MRHHHLRRGFTLIEMLITTAIVAIMSAALLAPIVAPAQENKVAARDFEVEGAYTVFFASLLEDAHSASSARIANDGSRIEFVCASGRRVLYAIDETNAVRRWQADGDAELSLEGDLPTEAVSAMLKDVELFAPRLEADGRQLSIGIGIRNPRPARMNEPPRSATFSIGFPKGVAK